MSLTLQFLGAAGTVTGSRALLSDGRHRVLVDCGLFQGFKQLREQNWAPFPVNPRTLDAVVLTHAHLDHTGYLPRLVAQGFSGPVYCSTTTADLCRILLPDSGFILEEEAERANRYRYTRHDPALPLYTADEARWCLRQLSPLATGEEHEILEGVRVHFVRAGHIPGACSVAVRWGDRSVGFSGDLGRPTDPLLPPPEALPAVEHLVVESTYGDRIHDPTDPEIVLGDVVRRTIARKGHVIIPAFAVGRTQRLLFHLHRMRASGDIPPVPIWLNSPLAQAATDVFRRRAAEFGVDPGLAEAISDTARFAVSREESVALNYLDEPSVIIAGSGMLTGGRVLHHLRAYGPDPRHTLLLTGFQAGGTRGEALLRGSRTLRIFGNEVAVEAEVASIDTLSAHADAAELVGWMARHERPKSLFLNHGEPASSDALRRRVQDTLGWPVRVPFHRETVTLGGA